MAQEHTHRKDVSAQQQRDAAAQQREEATHRAPATTSAPAPAEAPSTHDGVASASADTAASIDTTASTAATASADTAASTSVDAPSKPAPTPWGRAVGLGLIASALITVVLLAFLWPTYESKAKDVTVDVVASQSDFEDFTQAVGDAAEKNGQDLPFELTRVDDRSDAVAHIKERDAYGAFVLPASKDDKLEVLTASAANTSVSSMLGQTGRSIVAAQTQGGLDQAKEKMSEAASQQPGDQQAQQAADPSALQEQMQKQVGSIIDAAQAGLQGPTITDLVPLSDDDPQGAGLAVASLPLTIGGIVGGSLMSFGLKGSWRRLLGVVVYAVVGGLAMVLILDAWFGFAPAPAVELWAAVTLSLAGTVGLIVGLNSLIGGAGIGVGALITMLIGNPISGAQSPKEFLPGPFGEIGQFFVPGATGTLVRDLSYFPDASLVQPWLVLGGWVVVGLLLIILGHHRTGGHAHKGAPRRGDAQPEPATA
ncbi:ABC transporter permease [Brachybacterium halotolerans subsp. kimchii]|uniref:ABC transporter permease n=1 Tax=Brachybacterium halotolerans TaxID=2795215 RepID=UPI001E5E4E90|nr:ABC transporter permease [Brachybacterium halotolerans]UEJ82027.1 ABC transporter permease [Brachybacterium halotolerans subsp. kimchii]